MALPQRQMVDDEMTTHAWRVLVCAPFPPRLDGRHGGSRALAQFLSRLAARHSVGLVVLKGHDEASVDERLREACEFVEEVEIPRVESSLAARLHNRVRLRAALIGGTPTWAAERTAKGFGARLQELARTWRPDIVQFEYRIMAQFLPAIGGSIPLVLVDLDPASSEGTASPLLHPLEARAWRALGRSASRYVDSLVVLTERDRQLITELSGQTPIARIPLGYELPASPLDPRGSDPNRIVSIGSFIHPPNIDAALWLAREIFPAVKARIPAASLQLVGSHPPLAIQTLDVVGVDVRFEVPDVRPFLDSAAVVAAPIRMGGGMRVKVLEALAYGKAVVATSLALEGLDVEHGVQAMIADTGEEFAAALVALLTDAQRRAAIANAARTWAERHLDLDSQVCAYEELYAAVVDGRNRLGTTPRIASR
jgi:glycosyltransferase involved in cell wall biosynthesis